MSYKYNTETVLEFITSMKNCGESFSGDLFLMDLWGNTTPYTGSDFQNQLPFIHAHGGSDGKIEYISVPSFK